MPWFDVVKIFGGPDAVKNGIEASILIFIAIFCLRGLTRGPK